MQIDTQKFLDLSLYLNLVWVSPLQIVLAMYFLWDILGPSSLAGNFIILFNHNYKNHPKTALHINFTSYHTFAYQEITVDDVFRSTTLQISYYSDNSKTFLEEKT